MSKTLRILLCVVTILFTVLIMLIIVALDKQEVNNKEIINSSSKVTVDTKKELEIVLIEDTYEFTGQPISPKIKVFSHGKELSNKDYAVSFKNNTNVGKSEVTVVTDNNTATNSFNIVPRKAIMMNGFTSTESTVRVSWQECEQSTSYKVFRIGEGTDEWIYLGKSLDNQLWFEDKSLSASTKYQYAVKAQAEIGGEIFEGAISESIEVMTSPLTPSIITYSESDQYLEWSTNESAVGYEVCCIRDDLEPIVLTETTENYCSLEAFNDVDRVAVRAFGLFNGEKIYSSFSDAINIHANTNDSSSIDDSSGNASDKSKKHQISVKNIMQYPELPTGCETTALTIILNHYGYDVDKLTIAREYLPKLDFYSENGIDYGADFRTTFAGNPENEYSYGCYAPCIVTTADSYLSSVGAGISAHNVSGNSFDSLLSTYIDNDIPVLIWITSDNLHETQLTSTWQTPEGETVQWVAYEHCVVLTGYDLNTQMIYVSDPLVGNTSYSYSLIRQRYVDMGQQCVWIG